MRSHALKSPISKRAWFEKQRGPEKTMFRVMALNTEDGGDIGYLYYSNLGGQRVPVSELPPIEEKIKFSEFRALQVLGKPQAGLEADLEAVVPPGKEVIYLLKKVGTEQASYKCSFYPRLGYLSQRDEEEIRRTGKRSQIE
jgi:hypothetical protein